MPLYPVELMREILGPAWIGRNAPGAGARLFGRGSREIPSPSKDAAEYSRPARAIEDAEVVPRSLWECAPLLGRSIAAR